VNTLIDKLSRVFGRDTPTILNTVSALITIFALTKFGYPPLRRWFLRRFWVPHWVNKLEEAAKRAINRERDYLDQFIHFVSERGWDPRHYVEPTLHVKEAKDPISPMMMLLGDDNSGDNRSEMTLVERRERFETRKITDLLREIRTLRCVVVLGDPGSGKTVCLLQLAIQAAREALLSARTDNILPVFIPLNEFKIPISWNEDVPQQVLQFFKEQIRKQHAPDSSADIDSRLDILVRDGRILFLFDAMDEMPPADYYERFKALARFVRANPDNRFVFSCRLLDYIDEPTLPAQQIALAPFTNAQIRKFFKLYLGKEDKSALMEVFNERGDLARQARSPFFLSLISACVKASETPGGSWDVLVGRFVYIALDNERKRRGLALKEWQPLQDLTLNWLSELAFDLTEAATTRTVASSEIVAQALSSVQGKQDLFEIARRAGILRQLSTDLTCRFEHHKLQEYFAARKLATRLNSGSVEVHEYLDDIWWREVVVMASGLMDHPDHLIQGVLEEAEGHPKAQFTASRVVFARTLLAVRCYVPTIHKLEAPTKQMLHQHLIHYLRSGNILQRVRCLRITPQLEDPRIASEVKKALKHPSSWVRETALNALLESRIMLPTLPKTIFQYALDLANSGQLLAQGLHDIPILMRNARTRWFIPLFLAFMLFSLLKAGWVWGLTVLAAWLLYAKGQIQQPVHHFLLVGVPILFAIFRTLERKRYFRLRRFASTFNSFSLFWTLLLMIFNAIAQLISFLQKKATGISNLAVGTFNLALVLFFYLVAIKRLSPILSEWVNRLGRKSQRPYLDPNPTISGRTQQSRTILLEARREPDPLKRKEILDKIRLLLPVAEEILDDLEEFSDEELDVEVRTKVWRVYEQVELAVERTR